MRLLGWAAAAFLLLVPSIGSSQTVSATTGALNGRVSDNTGAVLPGVTITISSPSLMGTRTAVTNEEGLYRFPAIPPGEYTIVYELPGFTTVRREAIRVGLGFTATVNIELGVASLQESVTVTGESPVVDTAATSVTTNFGEEQLANLPSARDLWSILAQAPAVSLTRIDVGGSAAGTQTGYFAYGTTGQNRPMVEGIVATEGTAAAGFYYDYGSFDEVSVGTAAHSAEMPWPGIQTQFISKSGGNTYHGKFYGDYQNESIQSFNVDEDQVARGAQGGLGLTPRDVNRLTNYHDINADVGGFVTKDRLWWYGSFRDQDVSARYVNFPVKPHRTRLTNYTGKGTFNISENNKLIGYAQAGRKHQPTRLDPFGPVGGSLGPTTAINLSEEATWEQLYWGWVWKGEYNWVISDAAFFELRGGQFGYDWPNLPNGTDPRFEDIGNLEVRGGNRDWERTRRRNQVLGSVSYFKDNMLGNHNFKFGGEIFRETVTDNWKDGYPGDIVHVLRNGAPIEVYLIEAPSISENGLWTYSGYANDTWRIGDRLTLNVGIRFDRYRAFLPEQEHAAGRFNPTPLQFAAVDNVIDWNLFAPRAGGTFDLRGNGKTVVKFNFGDYWFNPGADFLFNVNPNSQVWWRRYTWTDPNGSGVWEQGEQGAVPLQVRGGVANESTDPDLKNQYTREFAAWFEHEVFANFGVRTGIVWRGERNHYQRVNVNQPFDGFTVPVNVRDPGPDGRLNTSDDGGTIAALDLDPSFRGRAPVNQTRNVPNSDSSFTTWEITATKRHSRRWSLMATFAHTWSREQAQTFFGQNVRNNTFPVSPNDLINTSSNGTYDFTTWQGKINATIEGPWEIKVTPAVRHQAGQPFGRTFSSTLSYGSVRFLAEPIDTRRMDNITIVDLRFEKVIPIRTSRISGFIDLYNLFNANPEQNLNWVSGGSFLRPLNIVPPRIARFGAKFEW
jgi:hypothetical protein